MAEPKVVLERTYNIPLRKEWLKSPKYRRAKKAVNAVKEFLEKHMKSKDVKVGRYLNLEIWKDGIRNPPHHVKVGAKKFDDGKVMAEIVGAPVEKPVEKKVRKAAGMQGKLQEAVENIKGKGSKKEDKAKASAEDKPQKPKDAKEPKKVSDKASEKVSDKPEAKTEDAKAKAPKADAKASAKPKAKKTAAAAKPKAPEAKKEAVK